MKNALNNQVGILGDMFLWLVANLKQGVIYFIKQVLPPNKSAGSVAVARASVNSILWSYYVMIGFVICIIQAKIVFLRASST